MDFIALESAKLHYVFENIFHVVERLVSEKEAKMNKIFKVIWSKSKQCYVVVSELAKNTTGKKKIIVAGIFSALAIVQFGQVAQVQADGSIGSSNHKGSIVINGTWKAGYTYAKATDENAIAIGQNAQATGRGGVALGNDTQSAQNSIAAAWDSQATGKNSVAVGTGTRATGLSSTAVGDSAQATVNRAVALGTDTRATGLSSTAVGDSAQATANGAVALGQSTESAGNSVAAGFNAKARSNNTVAIGVEANNDGSITNNASSVSVGVATRARAVGSMAMGVSADASGKYSLALGSGDVGTDYTAGTNYPSASGEKSIAIGYKSNASDLNALAIGTGASVDKQNATAVGSGASVTGHNATAVGNDTKAIKQYDNAFGYTSTASGGAATAVGYYATASGNNAVALGSTINTTAQYATGIGYSVNSQGEGAVAIGAGTDALGAIPAKQVKATAKNAIAIGRATQATSQDATAIGTEATASNTDAIAIGRKSNASGSTSIGFGYNTQSTDTNTVAIGTDVSATAESAIALGRKTTASALNATAVGPIANASGKYSSAFGMSAVASKENSLALGTDANASQASGVALGYSSTANTASGVAGYNPNTGHSDTYTALSGKTLTSTLGAVSVGNATNTRQITGVAAGTADTDAVNVAQLKSVNLAFTGNTGNGGDVNLSKSKLAVEGGTNSFITTEAANKKLEIKTTQGKLKNTTGTVSVDGDNGLAVAQNVADVINQANADQSIKYKANGTGSNSVKLSDGLNFTNGTTTTATVGANGQVTFDLNTATQKSITDSATAVARTISLGGDTGTTTAKSLTSGNVNFGVKSGSSTYLTTTANGNDVTLTVNEQAIKNAAKDASSFKVKANSTAAADVKGGDTVAFNNGDNIAITQNGKTFTIGTSKNVTFDTATIGGNTTIGSTGVTTNKVTVGAISIDGTNGINAGNKAITNVGTGIVANSNADNSNVANIGDVKTIANDAVANLSTNLGVTDGTNNGTVNLKTEKLKVVGTGAATATVNGQTVTVDVAKGTLAANAATGALTGTAGVVDANDMATAVNTAITKAVDNATGNQALKIGGDNAATGSVNLKSDTLSVKGDNKFITTAASGNDITLTVNEQAIKTAAKDAASFKVKANSEAEQEVKGGETVAFNDGDNIEITQTGKTFKIATSKNVTFDTATIGGNTTIGSTGITTNKVTVGGISIDGTNGINAGGKQITNVASGGTTATNAANIGDINAAISSLTTNLGKNTTIAYKANNAGGQTVSLADGFNFTNGTLTTAEVDTSGVVKFNVTQGALSTDTNGTVSAGTAGVATTADVASAVNSAVSTAVNNATSSQKLDISDGTTDGAVNLKTQKLTVAGTGAATATLNNQTITVNVAEGTFTNNTDGTTTATAGVAKAADVASAINNANTALSKKITDATASVSTLGSNTFTLKADSTDTTAQALNKSGGLAFKVAGDSDLVSTSATADTVKVTVKKGTLTTNADGTLNKTTDGVVTADNMKTVVNDAITKAVTSAKDGSAWNISTNGGTATKVSGGNTVDLINGDNIEITQDGTDGKKITVKTKKDLTVDSVTAANTVKVGSAANLITLDGATGAVSGNTFTAGNASMNTTGFRLTGGPSVTTAGIDAGGKQITNMISGGTIATNAATIGDVDTKVGDAITNLTTNLTKNTNIAYTANGAAAGQTVSLKDGFNFSDGTLTTAEVAANGVVKFNVTQGSLSTDANGNITNTGGVATTDDVKNAVTSAINTAVTKATGSQVLNITDGTNNGSINLKNDALKVVGADGVTTEVSGKTITVGLDTATKDKINNANTATNRNISLAADSGATSSQSLKDGDVSFAVKGATGDYISTNMNGSTVEISTKRATINSNATTGEASVTGNDGLATAKNVADAINAATTKAVAQSAWKLSADGGTTTETISGGDTVNFAAGKNIEITRTGKEIKVAMKDDVTFNKLNVGTGANAIGIDGTNGKITAKDIAATGDVSANNVTATGLVKGDTVQGNTVKAGNVTITGGTTNTITGLSNTTWTPTGGIQADRAATEGQLQQAINQVNNAVGNTALTFKGDSNSAQTMTLKDNTFAITGDTMIKTTTNTSGIGLSLDTSKVNIAYAANGANGQTTSLTSGFNFTDGDHTKTTVAANGVVKYDAKTSSITVTNGQATASGTDLATADNVAHAINQMTQANAGNTTQLRQEINKVATETQRVGAHAAAMAALKPIQYDPLEPTQVMAGVGNYHGETAAALGLAHYTNENTMFNVGVSLGGNHNMVNAGVTHKFGSSPEKKNIPDRYKAGPISSIYVMQDEMTQLRTENESYKAKLDQQQSEIVALKAAVDKLLAAKA